MRKYSLGVFFDIFSKSQSERLENLKFVNSLRGVEHLEILSEHIPGKEEFDFFFNLRKKYRLIIHAAFLDLTVLSPHQLINDVSLDILEENYQFGIKIGVEVLTIHVGQIPKFWKEDQARKNILSLVSKLQRKGKIPVCVENMPVKRNIQIPYPCSLEHIEKVSKIAPLTLDIGHLLKSGIEPYGVIERYGKRICNIHLHDATKGKDHLQLGTGDLDLNKLLFVLDKINYDGFLTLEVVGRKEIRKSWDRLLGTIDI